MNDRNQNLPIISSNTSQLVKKVGTSLTITKNLLAKSNMPTAEDWEWWNSLNDWWKFICIENLDNTYGWDHETFPYEIPANINFNISNSKLKKIIELKGLFIVIHSNPDDISPLTKLTEITALDLFTFEI